MAHGWAGWLHNPCRLKGPNRFRAVERLRNGAQMGHMGRVATQPLTPEGSPPLQSGGKNQKWPTDGAGGYITPAA